jgi:hypothetical protein
MRLALHASIYASIYASILGLQLVGCAANGDDGYPPRPGNGGSIGGGGGGGGDAGVGDAATGDAAAAFGRVCLISDLRNPTACAGSGAGNLLVQRGAAATATTRADGRFDLPPAAGAGDRWIVTGGTGSNLVSSVVPFMPGAAVRLPIVAQPTWDAMRTASGITPLDGTGAIHVLSLLPNGSPKLGATVTVTPRITSTYYADTSATLWISTPGTTSGVSLVPNLTAGQPVDIGGAATGNVRTTLLQQPIVANSITWVTLDFLQ